MSLQRATLGGGCFWCIEAALRDVRGVLTAISGYSGGVVPNPGYAAVCDGDTGHAEVVELTFDDTIVSYRQLLEMFFALHDPTTLNRQGADVGTQYRSVIFCHDDAQCAAAHELIAALESAKVYAAPIVTEVRDAAPFYAAEDYHQNYYGRNPTQGYCAAVIAPKLAKFRRLYAGALVSGRSSESQ